MQMPNRRASTNIASIVAGKMWSGSLSRLNLQAEAVKFRTNPVHRGQLNFYEFRIDQFQQSRRVRMHFASLTIDASKRFLSKSLQLIIQLSSWILRRFSQFLASHTSHEHKQGLHHVSRSESFFDLFQSVTIHSFPASL